MPVSEILQRLQKRAQVVHTPLNKEPENKTAMVPPPRASASTERVIDPVVASLKAARKRENEAKMNKKPDKHRQAAKKPPTGTPRAARAPPGPRTTSAQTKAGARSSSKQAATPGPVNHRQNTAPKKPKMTFNELMKKASSIDHLKMSINFKPKPKSPDPQQARDRPDQRQNKGRADPHQARDSPDQRQARGRADSQPTLSRPDKVSRKQSPVQTAGRLKLRAEQASIKQAAKAAPRKTHMAAVAKAPIPLRKPSSGLEQRLKSTRAPQPLESESDDMDSFIESDDDESDHAKRDYDRDEIWSIFNRGRKRSYYNHADEDSDDMEATGAEILEEEMRSKRNALEEDRREMEEEARLAALKKSRRR